VIGVIQELFDGRERTRALGAYAIVGGIAGVIGPLVGGIRIGALGEAHGWRSVLLLNVPFGLLTISLAVKWFPAGKPVGRRRTSLDLPGLAGLAAVPLCLLLPFASTAAQGPPRVVLSAPAGPGRAPIIHGLAVCAGMLAIATVLAWRDVPRGHRPAAARSPSHSRRTYLIDRT
jgi:MFS family permease